MRAFISMTKRNTQNPSTKVLFGLFDHIKVEAANLACLLDGYGDTQSFGREE